ncbi:MAG: serine protease [Verrucomicrobiota bacterium]|nr:serine protease [Verrucomicrobiota bacterium]
MSSVDPSPNYAKVETKFDLKDVKIVLPDETELPAQVVLRDEDWDMAFLRPTAKPAKPLAAVDLAKSDTPQVFDEVVAVGRMAKVASHVPALYSTRIAAVVRKPRAFYVPQTMSGYGLDHLGMPVFAMNGRLIGVILLRMMAASSGGGFATMMGGAEGIGIAGIVLPASQILETAKQAPAEAGSARTGKKA